MKIYWEVFALLVKIIFAIFCNTLDPGDTGNVQSLNSACMTSNATFSHFVAEEKRKLYVYSTQKLTSSWFFLQVKVHTVYLRNDPYDWICAAKMCNRYLSTVAHNVLK